MYDVFVGSSSEGRKYAEIIVSALEKTGVVKCNPWWDDKSFPHNKSFFEALFEQLIKVDYAVFIATPDDVLHKRHKPAKTLRDNVLFEFGLFAGHLGRDNSLLIPIGDFELPSDLSGISLKRASFLKSNRFAWLQRKKSTDDEQLERFIESVVEGLLCANQSTPFLDIHQIRSPRANRDQNSFEHLMRATSLELRTKLEPQMQNHAPASEIESIISKVGLKSNLSLGIPGNQTQVDYLVKFDQLDRDEIDYLSRLFNAHIARDIVEECDNGTNVTRIGIHRRRTTITDSSFMNSVVNGLSVKPAIVDLDRDGGQTRVLGRFNPGENAVFVQDVTLTGRTPIRCIGELRRAEVSVNKLYSFIARAEHIDQITNYCDTAKVEFLPFCVLSMDGRLRLAE